MRHQSGVFCAPASRPKRKRLKWLKMKIEEPEAMREIHEIRRKMHEETKDMPPEELIAYHKKLAAEFEKEGGVKLRKLQKA